MRLRSVISSKWTWAVAISGALIFSANFVDAKAATQNIARAWQPLMVILGSESESAALAKLRTWIGTFNTMFNHMEVDDYTLAFADDVSKTLRSFSLDKFYTNLPEGGDPWRWLALSGSLDGDKYRFGKAKSTTMYGDRVTVPGHKLGDMSAVIRARPTESSGSYNNFLLQNSFGLVLGDLEWQNVVEGIISFLQILPSQSQVSGPLAGGHATAPVLLPAVAPAVEVVFAELQKAFPNLYRRFVELGSFEEVTLTQPEGADYQRLRVKVKLKPQTLSMGYGKFAKFLDSMDRLLWAKVDWIDSKGRMLLQTEIDTKQLVSISEFVLKDGLLVPFSGTQVYIDDVVDPMGDDLAETRLMTDARMRVLGLSIVVQKMQVDFSYRPTPQRAEIQAAVLHIPKIKFEGAALGIMSPAMINIFIPGNLQQLTDEFMRVATTGNEGNGIAIDIAIGKPKPDLPAAFEFDVGFEALNNFMVKFAMRIGMDRFLPDKKQREDIGRYITDARRDFSEDVASFESAIRNN